MKELHLNDGFACDEKGVKLARGSLVLMIIERDQLIKKLREECLDYERRESDRVFNATFGDSL